MDKREIRRAAARLRDLGKGVPLHRTDEERLRESVQALRNEDTYAAAATCPACQEARRGGDEGALCDDHLRKAMGL